MLDLGGVEHITIWNRHRAAADQWANRLHEEYPGLGLAVADGVAAAVDGADVVTVATRSREPLLDRRMLAPPVQVNAMGADRVTDRECASDLMAAAVVYADTPAGVLHESGDVAIPIAKGQLAAEAVHALADAPLVPPTGITVMKSVGAAVFDVAAARTAWASWLEAASAASGALGA